MAFGLFVFSSFVSFILLLCPFKHYFILNSDGLQIFSCNIGGLVRLFPYIVFLFLEFSASTLGLCTEGASCWNWDVGGECI